MYPNYDTVTGDPQGLARLREGLAYHYGIPNIINSNFNEGLSTPEIESNAIYSSLVNDEYIVADELGGGKGSLSELGLDTNFLGDTLLRKQLGYLSNEDGMDLDDFVKGTTGSTRDNYMKIMRGKTGEVLKQLKEGEADPLSTKELDLFSYFAPVIDPETGEYRLKQVVGTKEAMGKVEAAGAAVINSYGPKKFSTNPIRSFTDGFMKSMGNLLPSIEQSIAGNGDLVESAINAIQGNGWNADYDEWNASADYFSMQNNMDTPFGQTTVTEDFGFSDNWEGALGAVGNGASSLVQFAVAGRAMGGAARIVGTPFTLGPLSKAFSTGMLNNAADVISRWGGGMVLNYGEAYQAARDAGLSLEDSAAVGALTGVLNTALENYLGSNALATWLASGRAARTAARTIIHETGGDMSKLYDSKVSNKILRSLISTVDRFTAANPLGNAFEEGAEEFLQNEIKSSVEMLYDQFIAPDDVQVGEGRFGTDMFSKEAFKQALEEGAVGSILGLFGGFASTRAKENKSILPFIAAGEYESLLAGMNLALQKGAITQQQYDGVKARAEQLNKLYNDNKDLFLHVASLPKDEQQQAAESVLKQLRDQDEYIKKTKNADEDNYVQFENLLSNAAKVATSNGQLTGIDTSERFEESLRNAGRDKEADIIKRARQDAESEANKALPKPKRFENKAERLAWLSTRHKLRTGFNALNLARQITSQQLHNDENEINKLLTGNEELSNRVNERFGNDPTFVAKLEELSKAIDNAKTDEELADAVTDAKNFVTEYTAKFHDDNSAVSGITEFAKKQSERLNRMVDNLQNNALHKSLATGKERINKAYKKTAEQIEQQQHLDKLVKEEAEAEKQAKQAADYFTSDEYKNDLDQMINDPDTSEEDKRLAQSAKDGNTAAQLEIAQRNKKSVSDALTNTPESDTERKEALNQQSAQLDAQINYLQAKKTAEDAELDKTIAKPVKVDFTGYDLKSVTDSEGNTFELIPDQTKRSEKNGFVYTLRDQQGDTEITGESLDGFTILDKTTGERVKLSQLAKDQTTELLNRKKDIKYDEGDNEAADHDDKEESDDKPTGGADDRVEVAGTVRLAVRPGSTLDKLVNNPKTDVSSISMEMSLSENVDSLDKATYAHEQEAAKLYRKLLASADPIAAFEALSERERNDLVEFLPLQGVININGESHIVYTYRSRTKQKELLVRELLKNGGKLTLPAGSINRTAGYVNYQPNTNNTLVKGLNLLTDVEDGKPLLLLGDGSPLVIGIADSTGSVQYADPSNENRVLSANAVGTPGSPYLIIPASQQLTGRDGYVAKLNPAKIPIEVAKVLANIFADVSDRKIKLKDVVPANNNYGIEVHDDSVGKLRYIDVLNTLIFFGETTAETTREPSKTLFYDAKNGGIWRYGASQKALNPKDPQSIEEFALWMSQNKNFSISKEALVSKAVTQYGFSLGAIKIPRGYPYLSIIAHNNFLHTDLDIHKGLIGKSYLIIQNFTPKQSESKQPKAKQPEAKQPEAKQPEAKQPENKQQSDAATNQPLMIKLGGDNAKSQLTALPDGATIILLRSGDAKQTHGRAASLTKKGSVFVAKDGSTVAADDIIAVRKKLVDEYNKEINRIVKDEQEHPENMPQIEGDYASSVGLLISTRKPKNPNARVLEWVENPEYYKEARSVKVEYSEIKQPEKKPESKKPAKKVSPQESQENVNKLGLSLANPFAELEQTEQVKRLSDLYEKVLKIVTDVSTKDMYIAAVSMINQDRSALTNAGISEEALNELLDYEIDGQSIVSILNNLGKSLPKTKSKIKPINEAAPATKETATKKEAKPDNKETETEKESDTVLDPAKVTDRTSPFKLASIASNPQHYTELLNQFRDDDYEDIKELLQELNAELAAALPNYEVRVNIRNNTLQLAKRPGTPPADPADIPNTPITPTLDPAELNKKAGITDDLITGKRPGKPKFSKKFGGKGKPINPSVPMVVQGEAGTEVEADEEVKRYRRLLSKRAGGNVEVVNKLIQVLGESGNPAWAWSVMHENGVTLYEKLAEGAAYHEAFHRVSLLLLSNDERKRLYKLARREYSLYNKTDNEVEEFLAERFRESTLELESKPKSKLKQMLSDIWNFVKTFLGLNKTKIENINGFFKAIQNGKYKYATVNEASLAEFNARYAEGVAPLTINGVTLKQVQDSVMLGNIVNSLTSMTLQTNGIHNVENLEQGLSFAEVKEALTELRDKNAAMANGEGVSMVESMIYQKRVNIYNEILDNFNTVFRPLIDAKLQGYNIRRIEDSMDDKDDLENLVNDEIKSAYEFSAKENAAANVRVLFLTLRSSENLDPNTGLPLFANPETAWFNTFNAIHSARSIDEMLEILQKKADETNTINQAKGDSSSVNMYTELYNILTETDEDGNQDELLKTRFWNTFKKHRNRFINSYFAQDTTARGKALSTYSFRFGNADVNRRSTQLERNWSSMFGINRKFEDTEALKTAIADYTALIRRTNSPQFFSSDYAENAMELVRILNAVGIPINYKTIGVLLNKYYFNSNLNVALRNLIKGIPNAGGVDPVGLSQMFGEKGIFQQIVKGKVKDITGKALNLLNSEKAVKQLAMAYVAANPVTEDDSVLGPGGNLVYSYSEYNTVTALFEDWLKDDAFFNQLLGVTYNKSSYWLSQLQDKRVRNNVHVDTLLTMIATDEYDTGRGYLEIASNEDLLLKFNAVLNGKIPIPTLANKRTYYFITGIKPADVRLQNGQIDEATVDIFANYAIGEYQTIQAALKTKNQFLSRVGVSEDAWNNMSKAEQAALMKSKGTDYTELVENYHYIIKDGAMRLVGNGYNFRYFTSLQDKLNDPKHFESITNQELRNVIRKALAQQVNNTIKLFINQGLINGNNKYSDVENIKEVDDNRVNTEVISSNQLLPASLLKTDDAKADIAEAIAKYAINTAISTIEFEKVISGDLAYYKANKGYQSMLDDRVKRYSAVNSTKSILREDWPEGYLDFDTHQYNVAIFASEIVRSETMYNEMMAKYVGTDEHHGLMWQRLEQLRDQRIGRYADMTDEELKAAAIEESKKRLEGYLETDQTDAQVLISPKMFRKLSIMNGEWDDVKEDAFNLLESDEPLTLEQELQAYTAVMQPLKYIHFGYDFFNGLQVPIYDKMSLATVFKRVAEGRDLQKVYDLMNSKDIDMIKFDSAVKSGGRQKGKFYEDGKPSESIQDIPVYKQQFKYLGKQLVTDPHHMSRIALGTQVSKIGISGVIESDVYEINGTQVTGQQLIDDYTEAVAKLSSMGRQDLLKELGAIETEYAYGKYDITLDKAKFIQMLKDDAIRNNSTANLIDALTTVEDENGRVSEFVQLSGLPALNWIQSRIISMIKKQTVDINTPGGSMIQMSNFAFKNSTVEVDTSNYNYATNQELRFKNENDRLECIVSINLFKDVLPKAHLLELATKNGTSYFEEARKFILSNKDLAILSYRVPTQGTNSTLAAEVVDVLPSNNGDTIVLPAELTKLTGADQR